MEKNGGILGLDF